MTGDPRPLAGLEAIYWARRADLLRFVRARTSEGVAEDIIQELWLKIRAVNRPIDDPLGYLYRAADNLIISRHRSALRSARRDDAWHAERPVADPSRPDELVAHLEQIARVEQRLRALGARAFRIFVMFRLEGIAQRTIADRLDVGLSTVEKELQRAYRAIAELKAEKSGFDAAAALREHDNDE